MKGEKFYLQKIDGAWVAKKAIFTGPKTVRILTMVRTSEKHPYPVTSFIRKAAAIEFVNTLVSSQ